MKIVTGIIASMAAVGTVALGASGAFAQECKDPDQLVFSIIPTEETTQELDIYQPLLTALKEKTGKSVEFFMRPPTPR